MRAAINNKFQFRKVKHRLMLYSLKFYEVLLFKIVPADALDQKVGRPQHFLSYNTVLIYLLWTASFYQFVNILSISKYPNVFAT